ncbi:MAG: nucleotidyltransferase domain-containing protein [Beijerinckiaceae bacterium]
MASASANDPILSRFRAALDEMYGDQIERVVLFGSRARGEAQADSDYDVAVFLKSLPDRWKEIRRLADLRVDFIDDTGAFFDAKPFPATAYRDRTPLMHEIRRDGLDL